LSPFKNLKIIFEVSIFKKNLFCTNCGATWVLARKKCAKQSQNVCAKKDKEFSFISREESGFLGVALLQYGTHHSYVLVVHTLRVAENEILKLDFPAKRH
jgi:ribosomal protein S27AE